MDPETKDLFPKENKTGWIFYYDESNNIRKFRLKDGHFSTSEKERFFVLGGLLVPEGSKIPTTPFLNGLKLEKSVSEIKFRHFSSTRNFEEVLRSKRIQLFFQWLVDNQILIHINVMNWIYYSLVDIVDSLGESEKDQEILSGCHFQLKAALYSIADQDIDEFGRFLSAYDYPNIPKGQEKDFLSTLQSIIENADPLGTEEEDFFVEFLRQMVKKAKANKELIYIQDNETADLVQSFGMNYIESICLFPHCYHILDQESSITKEVEENCSDYANFRFVNSKDELFIQLSDVFVGFIVSALDFSRQNTQDEIAHFCRQLPPEERQVLLNLRSLIDESDAFSRYILAYVLPPLEILKFESLWQIK
jgi:hypothetical protein